MSVTFQNFALFNEFPRIDPARLRASIVSLEPDANDVCEVSEFVLKGSDIGSVLSGVITYGGLNVAVQIYGAPVERPQARMAIEMSNLPEEQVEKLRNHRVHALCTCLGGADYEPVESIILLLKTGMALVSQGAIAVINEQNATCYPDKLMKAFANFAKSEADAGELDSFEDGPIDNSSLWEGLRDQGLPGELLVGFVTAQVEGRYYFCSSGHYLYDLPDVILVGNTPEEQDSAEDHLKAIFYYLYENGPVLIAGSVLGDEPEAYRFEALPDYLADLAGPAGTLLVSLASGELSTDESF